MLPPANGLAGTSRRPMDSPMSSSNRSKLPVVSERGRPLDANFCCWCCCCSLSPGYVRERTVLPLIWTTVGVVAAASSSNRCMGVGVTASANEVLLAVVWETVVVVTPSALGR